MQQLFVRITMSNTLNPRSSLIKLTEKYGNFGKESGGTFDREAQTASLTLELDPEEAGAFIEAAADHSDNDQSFIFFR